MALVNVGEILADAGYQVILCDFDLEAPGLERYLVDEAAGQEEIEQYKTRLGLMDLLQEYKSSLSNSTTVDEEEELSSGPTDTLSDNFEDIGSLKIRRPSTFTVPVHPAKISCSGSIRLLSAGRRGGEWEERYNSSVQDFNWRDFYERWSGAAYFEFFRSDLNGATTIVLVDSRTGVTEHGGVCTHHLADLVVLFSAANDLNVRGTKWMADILSSDKVTRMRGSRPFDVMPIASRIEVISETRDLVSFRNDFAAEFSRRLPDSVHDRSGFFTATEIPYIPHYSFKERIVARQPPEQRHSDLYGKYVNLAHEIIRWGIEHDLLERVASARPLVREPATKALRPSAPPVGRYLLLTLGTNDEFATFLAQSLRAAGLDVWWDGQSSRLSAEPAGQAAEQAEQSRGILLLVDDQPTTRLDSWLNYALARKARDEGYRVVVLILEDRTIEDLPSLARRHPIVRIRMGNLPRDTIASRLVAELLAHDPLVPEPASKVSFPVARPFDQDESRFFFGRDGELVDIVALAARGEAEGKRWLIVQGLPGVGKSSFVRAGLLPAMTRGWVVEGSMDWTVTYCTPGSEPLVALARALADAALERHTSGTRTQPGEPLAQLISHAEIHAKLQDSPTDLIHLAAEIAGVIRNSDQDSAPPRPISETLADNSRGLDRKSGFVLVIDPVEDLFQKRSDASRKETLSKPAADFVKGLASAITASPPWFYVVMVARSDLLPRLKDLPGLGEQVDGRAAVFRLKPLTLTQVDEILGGTSRLFGVRWEPGLREAVLADLSDLGPAAPLVMRVLNDLWLNRRDDVLTHEAYSNVGRAVGILVRDADNLLQRFEGEERAAVRRLFIEMVGLAPDGQIISLAIDRREALTILDTAAIARPILDALVGGGILSPVDPDMIDFASRFLPSQIPTLAGWVEKERVQIEQRDTLYRHALVWDARGRPDDLLPSASSYLSLSQFTATRKIVRDYLDAVARKIKQQRRRRFLLALTLSVLMIGLVMPAPLLYLQLQEITTVLNDAQARATSAEERATRAEERTTQAEARVAEAESRATQAEERATQAEERATQAEERATQAEARVAEAESRATQAEERATQAEKQLNSLRGKVDPEGSKSEPRR